MEFRNNIHISYDWLEIDKDTSWKETTMLT